MPENMWESQLNANSGLQFYSFEDHLFGPCLLEGLYQYVNVVPL